MTDTTIIMDLLNGYHSDHLPQIVEASFYENDLEIFSIRGASWNMMNQCHSKMGHNSFKSNPNNAYANNPFDVDENKQDYVVRKKAQWEVIEKLMIEGCDFIFLQEIDCFYRQPTKSFFEEKIAEKNWSFLISPTVGYQGLAILYNPKSLVAKETGIGEFGMGGKFRGFSELFTYHQQYVINLVNLHLDYYIDYTEYFKHYQFNQIQNNIITIMGGDLNSPYGSDLINWLYASNISCNDDGNLTDLHNDSFFKKKYDNFFINPNLRSYVKLKLIQDSYFDITDNIVCVKTMPNGAQDIEFTSLKGEDWLERQKLSWQQLNYSISKK